MIKKIAYVSNGIHVSEVLLWCIQHPATYFSELMRSTLTKDSDPYEISDFVDNLDDEDSESSEREKSYDSKTISIFKSVTNWPAELWEAMCEAYSDSHILNISEYEYHNLIATEHGLDEDIIHDLALLKRIEVKPGHSYKAISISEIIQYITRMFDLVINKFPNSHANYLKDNISFYVSIASFLDISGSIHGSFIRHNLGQVDKELNDYANSVYGIDLHLAEENGFFKTTDKTEGFFETETGKIVIWKLNPVVICHELGHAVWNYTYTKTNLSKFLIATTIKIADRANTITEFHKLLFDSLDGLVRDNSASKNAIDGLLRDWGLDYSKNLSKHKWMRRLSLILKDKKFLINYRNVLSKLDTSHLLVAWTEIWAEAFIEVILHKPSRSFKVPGLILKMVKFILTVN
jgi:hypothetical protein